MVIDARAQLNPLGSQYYQNQYLANPAMAGMTSGFELGAAYKAQWTAIDGTPSMQSITGTYGSKNNKVGVGLNFYNETAGVIRRTSLKASYAYHLQLNNPNNFIDFGLSAGLMNERIDGYKVKGDLTDISLANFNDRKIYFDGDFGFAVRSNGLTLQGALPNLKRFFRKDVLREVVDRSLYMGALSYLIQMDNGNSNIEPKVAYRGIQNYKDILDVGANLKFYHDKLIFTGLYHSTNSVTIGAGTLYKNQLSISAQYTTNTSDLQTYSNGEFEVGLKYSFK